MPRDFDWSGTFWARRGSYYFNNHRTGKAAVRLATDPVADGPHKFSMRRPGRRRTRECIEPCLLHYVDCGRSRFVQKYRTLGRFADRWFEKYPIPGFYLNSRDVVLDGAPDDVDEFYRTHIMLREVAIEDALDRGLLRRYALPQALFG